MEKSLILYNTRIIKFTSHTVCSTGIEFRDTTEYDHSHKTIDQ